MNRKKFLTLLLGTIPVLFGCHPHNISSSKLSTNNGNSIVQSSFNLFDSNKSVITPLDIERNGFSYIGTNTFLAFRIEEKSEFGSFPKQKLVSCPFLMEEYIIDFDDDRLLLEDNIKFLKNQIIAKSESLAITHIYGCFPKFDINKNKYVFVLKAIRLMNGWRTDGPFQIVQLNSSNFEI